MFGSHLEIKFVLFENTRVFVSETSGCFTVKGPGVLAGKTRVFWVWEYFDFEEVIKDFEVNVNLSGTISYRRIWEIKAMQIF